MAPEIVGFRFERASSQTAIAVELRSLASQKTTGNKNNGKYASNHLCSVLETLFEVNTVVK